MSSAPPPPSMAMTGPPIALDNSLGAALIGLIAAAMLFGITNMQSLMYYQSSSRDPRPLRLMVGALWSLDTLHIVLISDVIYDITVRNFTNLAAISTPTWSLCFHIVVTTLSDFIVRSFYARRVWILSRHNWYLTCGAAICAFVTFVSGIGFAAKTFTFSNISQFTKLSWLLYLALGSGVAADVLVACTLCYYLSQNRTGFAASDTKINVLMMYVINTGLLTSLCAICCFVSFAVMPHTFIYIGFYFILSKLYFNSLLATLNARDRLRDPLGASHAYNFHASAGNSEQTHTLASSSTHAYQLHPTPNVKQDVGVGLGQVSRSPPRTSLGRVNVFSDKGDLDSGVSGSHTSAQNIYTSRRLDFSLHRPLSVKVETVTDIDDGSESGSLNRTGSAGDGRLSDHGHDNSGSAV